MVTNALSTMFVMPNQPQNPPATLEPVSVNFKDQVVKARLLTVQTQIPRAVAVVWDLVQQPALFPFVAKGMIRFLPEPEGFPTY